VHENIEKVVGACVDVERLEFEEEDQVRNGLEGLVAKRLDSMYEPGQRSGAWRKMRINQAQDFVIGGYTVSAKNFDQVTAQVSSSGSRHGRPP
jgi:ATP-dependent DNA ligase